MRKQNKLFSQFGGASSKNDPNPAPACHLPSLSLVAHPLYTSSHGGQRVCISYLSVNLLEGNWAHLVPWKKWNISHLWLHSIQVLHDLCELLLLLGSFSCFQVDNQQVAHADEAAQNHSTHALQRRGSSSNPALGRRAWTWSLLDFSQHSHLKHPS